MSVRCERYPQRSERKSDRAETVGYLRELTGAPFRSFARGSGMLYN